MNHVGGLEQKRTGSVAATAAQRYLGEKIAKCAAAKKAGMPRPKPMPRREKTERTRPTRTEAEPIIRRRSPAATPITPISIATWISRTSPEVYHTRSPTFTIRTDYFNPRQAENFAIGMNLSLFGIGAVLQADMKAFVKLRDETRSGRLVQQRRSRSATASWPWRKATPRPWTWWT